jgi:hypothetical protein
VSERQPRRERAEPAVISAITTSSSAGIHDRPSLTVSSAVASSGTNPLTTLATFADRATLL